MSAISNPKPSPQPTPIGKPSLVSPPEEKKSFPSWIVWAVVLVLTVAGLGAWRYNVQQKEAEALAAMPTAKTTKVRLAPLHNSVRLTGVTSSRNYNNIMAPKLVGPEGNRPMVILKMVASGTLVTKGQTLVEIDGQSLQDHVDDVNATVEQAQGDERKRAAEHALDMETLMQSLRVAKSELDKVTLDAKAKELRTAVDQELLSLSVDELQAKYNQLTKEVDFKKAQQAAEMRILQFTTQRHIRHRDRHKVDLSKFIVRASMDGLAVVQPVFRGSDNDTIKVGDNVYPGQTIMKVVDPRNMQVEGTMNQAQVSEFRLGQTASISLDAFPGLTFQGKIYSIGALAVAGMRQGNFIRTIPVKISIDGFDKRLIPDLSAAADVQLRVSENKALLVPRASVVSEGSKHFVYVKQGANFVKTPVELGEMNEVQVAVSSGVQEGVEVALNYVQQKVEGTEVASRE
jgi:multidrug resistance efflux pump